MEPEQLEIATRVAKVWRAVRYDATHDKAVIVKELHFEWPELFEALEALQREWPK